MEKKQEIIGKKESENNKFAQKIKSARILAKFTQEELAARMGISISQLAKIESGKEPLNDNDIYKFAKATGQKLDFFLRTQNLQFKNQKFLLNSTITKKELTYVFERIKELAERHFEFFKLFSKYTPPVFVPSIIENSIQKTADYYREIWQNSSQKTSLVRFLESLGILVFTLKDITPKFSGMSMEVNDIPLIVVGCDEIYPIRQWSNLAHEFCHLLLKSLKSQKDDEEQICVDFSDVFLKGVQPPLTCEKSIKMQNQVLEAYWSPGLSDSKASNLLGINIFDFADLNKKYMDIQNEQE